jgi:hypothetical protein
MVHILPNAHTFPFTATEPGSIAAAPRAFVEAPAGRTTAPCVDVVATGSCVPTAVPVTCANATGIIQVDPNAQVCPLSVVPLFANAAFGIRLAVTAIVGAVVVFVTVGVNHAGHVPTVTLLTVPVPLPPLDAGQSVPFCKHGKTPPTVVPGAKELTAPVAITPGSVRVPPSEKVPLIGLNPNCPEPF